ncbi:MAG: hydantoinase/oxoprolinase family protein [Deltaproteobacteria bacterium]|nr:hydantoinase/oxoprolinase family protein [Deltaproteobacteria bacterium]
MSGVRVGVDSGGTFTDVIAVGAAGGVTVLKLPSRPDAPEQAVLQGVSGVGGATEVVHSTTVATNALLERRGGPTVLVTTAGFEDVLVLGRQARAELYALAPEQPAPLVADGARLGLVERLGPGGVVWRELDEASLAKVLAAVLAAAPRSVAVVLLHAYADGAHERRVEAALRAAGYAGPVSLSSRVLPEHREYERTSTTVVDAYVAPVVGAYVARLDTGLRATGARLSVMLSSGGVARAEDAAAVPARTALSGPAAGVVGARVVAARAGLGRILTFDMGGTSTDVALVDGEVATTRDTVIGGAAIALPMVDVHTVGAGGGSLAALDGGGSLVVGPESAGAAPGPACYGRGGLRATVTDAHVVLGRLAGGLAGGAVALDEAAARAAVARLGEQLGGGASPERVAAAIVAVADAVMARALRKISVERGRDPRDFTLVAFGGAGALHACALADELLIPRVLVPAGPGLLCAYGALAAPVQRDLARSLMQLVAAGAVLDVDTLTTSFDEMEAESSRALDAEAVAPELRQLTRLAELRYQGQSHELSGPATPGTDLAAAFTAAHQARFGFTLPRAIELIALRVIARGLTPPPPLPIPAPEAGDPVLLRRPVGFGATMVDTPVIARARLAVGAVVSGPAIIAEYSSTTLVPPGWRATVAASAALVLQRC